MDGLDAFLGGIDFLDGEEFQRVEGGGDIAAEDFEELQIAFSESLGLGAFDVKSADNLVLQD